MRTWAIWGLVLSGCFVPVDVRIDGGEVVSGADTGPCPVAPLLQAGSFPGEPVVVPLEGCGSAQVAVFGPDGSVVATSRGGVDFTPDAGGVYVVSVLAGGQTTQGTIVVDELIPEDAGVARRYVDRLDDCWELWTTSRQTVICMRADQANVANLATFYGLDGEVSRSMSVSRLSVVGDEVWIVTQDGGVQHYTDVGGSLRLDGEVFHPLSDGVPVDADVGVAKTGSIIVGSLGGFIHLRYDGGTFDATPYSPWAMRQIPRIDVDVDGQVWATNVCSLTRGCQSMLCSPVANCEFGGTEDFISGWEEDLVWIIEEGWTQPSSSGPPRHITFRERPLATSTQLGRRPTQQYWMRGSDATYAAFLTNFYTQLVPRRVGDHIQFRRGTNVAAVSRDWILVRPHPQVLRFVPR